ncbi:MAG: DUF1902 domain-containing protein [Defluviitaleaceae bacterium]|nr:DUF1902 domain-containing protein [Defluviitaleaceae bacterium]
MKTYRINVAWDDEGQGGVADSDDVPGFVVGHNSYDGLVERSKYIIHELLEFHGILENEVTLAFITKRHERVTHSGRV